jgi:hypothetical protein
VNIKYELYRTEYGPSLRAFYDRGGCIISVEECIPGHTGAYLERVMDMMEAALDEEVEVEAEAMSGL